MSTPKTLPINQRTHGQHWIWILATLGSLAVSCTPASEGDASRQLQARSIATELRRVSYLITEPGTFTESAPFMAVVMPHEVVALHFAVPGRLEMCLPKEGSVVQKGELICRLDSSVVDLEVKRAQSAADAAAQLLSSDFSDSQRELYESGVIGQIDYEKVRVQSESARATQRDARSVLELAKKKRAEHELRAPWTGRVTGLSLANGQLLTPDVTIGYLASVDGSAQTFRLETKLHATWFGRVTAGTKALVTQIAGNRIEPAILAEVTEVGAVVQPESQTFRVALTLGLTEGRGTEAALAQGMLARGQLQLTTGDKAMVVPASAIVEWDSDNNGTVFVIGADDRLRVRKLRLGRYSQDNVLVLQGLEVGERLVERWSPGLYEGLPVQPLASVRSNSP